MFLLKRKRYDDKDEEAQRLVRKVHLSAEKADKKITNVNKTLQANGITLTIYRAGHHG